MNVEILKAEYTGFTVWAWGQAVRGGYTPAAIVELNGMPEQRIKVHPPKGAAKAYDTRELAASDALLWSKDVIDKLIDASGGTVLHQYIAAQVS